MSKKQDQEKPFDFEAFIAGIKKSSRTVTVYGVDHSHRIAELQEKLERAESGASRFGQKSDVRDMAEEVSALREEMSAAAIEFTLEPPSPEDYVVLYRRKANGENVAAEQLAAQCTSHDWDAEQWERFGRAIGSSQFLSLLVAANELAEEDVVVPDFSQATSDALGAKGSAAS